MTPFDFDPSIRVVFGAGTLDQIGDLASALAGPRALLVTDPGLVQAGLAGQAQHALQNAGLTTTTFSAVGENPTTEHVAAGVHHARRPRPHRPNRRLGRRQRYGLRQRHQFPADQRRPNAGLSRLRQSRPTHATLHRHPDHSRNGQRGPILRPDYLRRHECQNSLRRPQSALPHRHPRPKRAG